MASLIRATTKWLDIRHLHLRDSQSQQNSWQIEYILQDSLKSKDGLLQIHEHLAIWVSKIWITSRDGPQQVSERLHCFILPVLDLKLTRFPFWTKSPASISHEMPYHTPLSSTLDPLQHFCQFTWLQYPSRSWRPLISDQTPTALAHLLAAIDRWWSLTFKRPNQSHGAEPFLQIAG